MIYRKFKDIELSVLGMGNMRLPQTDPEDKNSPIDYAESQKIIDLAMASGINYYDTAYVYNNGGSEEFLGVAMQKFPRDSFYLASKFNIEANPDYKAVFEEQLRRLNADRIDFYLLHCLTDGNIDKYLESGAIDYFEEQRKLGRITYFGFSTHASPDTLRRFVPVHNWDFIQVQLNYFDWEFSSAKEEYEICTEANIPVIVMESVRGGKLSDLGNYLNGKLTEKHPDWSVSSWAMRWLIGKPGLQLMLSGMSTLSQVEDNVKTFSEETALTDEENALLSGIAHNVKETLTVPCTVCRYCVGECPKGLEIPQLLKIYNDYKFNGSWEGNELDGIPEDKLPSNCIGCGACMPRCPQSIEIPSFMTKLANLSDHGTEE